MGDDWTHTAGPRSFATMKMKKAKELGRKPLMSEWLPQCKQTKRNPNAPEGTPQSQLQPGWDERIKKMDDASAAHFGPDPDTWPDYPDPRVWNAGFEAPVKKGKVKLAPRFNPAEGGFTQAPRYHPPLRISEGTAEREEMAKQIDELKEKDKKKDKVIKKLKKKLAPMSKMLKWFRENVDTGHAQSSHPPTVASDDSETDDEGTESDE